MGERFASIPLCSSLLAQGAPPPEALPPLIKPELLTKPEPALQAPAAPVPARAPHDSEGGGVDTPTM